MLMFDPKTITQRLEANKIVFESLLSNIEDDAIRWKPSADKWCLLEIIYHLIYEEEMDFRIRCSYALENRVEPIPPIDPEGWIQHLDFQSLEYPSSLHEFLSLRTSSISFLNQAISENANWNHTLLHPELGKLSAKMFLTNWLVHDHLHIKQILTLKNQFLVHKTQVNIRYAGGF